jgi:hypothetical protein
VRDPAPSRIRSAKLSVFKNVVVEETEKLPPTRYVPAGRVGEVTIVVAPFPTVTLVEVFTIVGGRRAFTAVGATTYSEPVDEPEETDAICLLCKI